MTSNILFHQFKHHLPYLKAWLQNNESSLCPEAIQTIKTIGGSQLDMYCGNLGVAEILQQAGSFLLQQGITENGQYRLWVGNGYKLMDLSDGSRFTLRCINHQKPVHIHPARHAPLTIRVKATALKSVIGYMLANPGARKLDIYKLNIVRKQYLGLPPVSALAGIEEMEKVAKMLANQDAQDCSSWL